MILRDIKLHDIKCWFLYFMLYSIFGWLYEVFLEVVVYGWGFSNRGVLFGPYCVIYGTGSLLLIFLLRGLKKRRIMLGQLNITPLLVFVAIVFITTALELLGSYIMEWTTGGWMWDYSRFSGNFQGRIAPNPSIRFGFGGMIFLYILQPLFERLTAWLKPKVFSAVSGVLAVIFLVDVMFYLF